MDGRTDRRMEQRNDEMEGWTDRWEGQRGGQTDGRTDGTEGWRGSSSPHTPHQPGLLPRLPGTHGATALPAPGLMSLCHRRALTGVPSHVPVPPLVSPVTSLCPHRCPQSHPRATTGVPGHVPVPQPCPQPRRDRCPQTHPELEGTHRAHRAQPLAPHRSAQNSESRAQTLLKLSLGAVPAPLGILFPFVTPSR